MAGCERRLVDHIMVYDRPRYSRCFVRQRDRLNVGMLACREIVQPLAELVIGYGRTVLTRRQEQFPKDVSRESLPHATAKSGPFPPTAVNGSAPRSATA